MPRYSNIWKLNIGDIDKTYKYVINNGGIDSEQLYPYKGITVINFFNILI